MISSIAVKAFKQLGTESILKEHDWGGGRESERILRFEGVFKGRKPTGPYEGGRNSHDTFSFHLCFSLPGSQ